jgi:hypothetical protein
MGNPAHFKDKEAIAHVAEKQAEGFIAAAEIHGTEIPGHIHAGADAARDTAMALALVWIILVQHGVPFHQILLVLATFTGGWMMWKAGRSAWLGWSRLERLHRVIEQEKYEIEHHRQQEREELAVLYAAKGFEGKLLQDVLDVLMADGDRLLRVMAEEELGLSLETQEHPLKQALFAAIGAIIAGLFCVASLWIYPEWGVLIGALLVTGISAAIAAHRAENNTVPAFVWNVALGVLTFGFVYFMLPYFFSAR